MLTEPLFKNSENQSNYVLSVAALFTTEFNIDLLVEITGKKPLHILEKMEEGLKNGNLISSGPGKFRFVDDERRKALMMNLSDKESMLLHEKFSSVLIDSPLCEEAKLESLSSHLLSIKNDVVKCRWLKNLGDLELKRFNTNSAIRCYGKILEDLSDASGESANDLYVKSALRYSSLHLTRNDSLKVKTILMQAIERAEKNGMQIELALLKMNFARNEFIGGKEETAFLIFEEGWSLAKKIDNPKLLLSSSGFRILFYYWQGRFKEAIKFYEKFVQDIQRFPKGNFPLMATVMAGLCYASCGQHSQGLGIIEAVRSHSKKQGNRYLIAFAQFCISIIMLEIGRIKEAKLHYEAAQKSASLENISYIHYHSHLLDAYFHYLNQEKDKAKRSLEKYNIYNDKGLPKTLGIFMLNLAWAIKQGFLPESKNIEIKKEIHLLIKDKNIYFRGIAYRFFALLQHSTGVSSDVIFKNLDLSLTCLKESGHLIETAKTQLELIRFYISIGDEKKASELAEDVYKVFSPINMSMFPDDLLPLLKKQRHSSDELLQEILVLGQEMVGIRDYQQLVQYILSTVNRITGAERGGIFIYDKTESSVMPKLIASKGLTQEDVEGETFNFSMHTIQNVIQTGKGLIKKQAGKQKKHSSFIRSCICVPMTFRGHVSGVLYHDNRLLPGAFRAQDLELLSYFAGQAAIAIDNAKFYEKLQRQEQVLSAEKQHYIDKNRETNPFTEIIGESKVMRKVLEQINQVADTDATVLITGETGVGKELIASVIHEKSKRREKLFIAVNISSLAKDLIPSELFGHEKGAFTGADRRRIGRFELAEGGTLFLDEIGELPIDAQVGLLRVLQDKKFERVGGYKTLTSDFRLIAATNRDLSQEVEAGRFRKDLYYRLNVFPIHGPPLRERIEDIPLLANFFLMNRSVDMGRSFDAISDSEMDKLIMYGWPGNVRELQNVIERGAILSKPPSFVVPDMLSEPILTSKNGEIATLKEVERQHILKVLQLTNWKVSGPCGASELLDMKRSTLVAKMKKLNINISKLTRKLQKRQHKIKN